MFLQTKKDMKRLIRSVEKAALQPLRDIADLAESTEDAAQFDALAQKALNVITDVEKAKCGWSQLTDVRRHISAVLRSKSLTDRTTDYLSALLAGALHAKDGRGRSGKRFKRADATARAAAKRIRQRRVERSGKTAAKVTPAAPSTAPAAAAYARFHEPQPKRCYHCRREGHVKYDCPDLARSNSRGDYRRK